MLEKFTKRDRALFYHRQLPETMRTYLNGRGIPDHTIDAKLLGWNGSRITIPVFGREEEVLFFRYARSPQDQSVTPKMLSEVGSGVELYGWETLVRKPYRIVICEGELDRLVLEANGILAVTSTAGATAFLPEWAPYFEDVRRIFVCFDRDEAGARGAETVKSILPRATIVTLPVEVGQKGDISDYFVTLGRTVADFEILLATAAATEEDGANPDRDVRYQPKDRSPAGQKATARRAERLKRAIPLDGVVRRYTELKPSGNKLLGRCPFHDDTTPSFVVYPETETYYCFGCRAHGDVIAFIQHHRSKTYHQALDELERLLYTDDQFRAQSA
jgi:DNA primase